MTLKTIADIDTVRDRGVELGDTVLVNDAMSIINDPEIDIVVELVGGDTIAKQFTLKALEKGKHVVTANKALIATKGNEIFDEASKQGLVVAFEAAVAGGMAAFGAGSAVAGLGSLVGGITSGIVGLFGGDTPLEKMQKFQEYYHPVG